ncbi:hypothetical protein [Natrononativus amylolyticus]|uniref:hypothetical protein n=1 Tax=Natrononativus amylolyticus TaxID=2963434 RepID=UPI0020CDFE63|nr:hypothetical protein [Natrononativus amylolyticus]
MVLSSILDGLGTACKRAGPGRLPGADRPVLGAGYAGASGALVAAALFAVAVLVLSALGSTLEIADPAFVMIAAQALLFVVPAAFVVSALIWFVLPTGTAKTGAVAGALATLLTYLVATALLAVVATVAAAASWSGGDPAGASVLAVLFGVAAFVWTAWIAVPVGCLGGAIYERVGTTA